MIHLWTSTKTKQKQQTISTNSDGQNHGQNSKSFRLDYFTIMIHSNHWHIRVTVTVLKPFHMLVSVSQNFGHPMRMVTPGAKFLKEVTRVHSKETSGTQSPSPGMTNILVFWSPGD